MEKDLAKLSLVTLSPISTLCSSLDQKTIRIRGFLSSLRCTSRVAFIIMRELLDTVQCVVEIPKDNPENGIDIKALNVESYIEITGTVKVVKNLIKSCTIGDVEIAVTNISILGPVTAKLPFSLKDASASEEEKAKNPGICKVSYNIRLDNRFLDFRIPHSLAIFRVVDGATAAFRNFTRKNGFMEIKTTKIIQSASEGGSNLFSMNYFGKDAFLVQSPQLYKQMAVIGGMKRVCEVGHVYRAEQSNINRYLSEFTGLDIEMELGNHYHELVRFLYSVLVNMFDTLKTDYSKELEIIRKYRPFEDVKYTEEPVIITHREAVDELRSVGVSIGYEDDFNREQEKILGGIVKKKHGVDMFVVTEYPEDVRAFYTYVDKETGRTHSYDIILRGEEVLSGARRVTNYDDLEKAVLKRNITLESLQFYLDCFKFGAPPHGGGGFGLERILKAYLDFDDIRYFALYPRDPSRIFP
ncbi:aspartyl-tRNA synthetase [Pancytospora epiphaga]|nr:aspartyl-tRNA synthetase [Pancytospora epiphaga]